jgi:photosystem II stability/assembly factor-like uncharacterized protein
MKSEASTSCPTCVLALMLGVLTACGGGRGGSPDAPPPTPLPSAVTITAPAKAQSSVSVAFAASIASSNGLTFKWDFGDGSAASAEPAPAHLFAQPGDYQVKLTVSDASGAARNASFAITVNNQAHVRGLVCSGADDAGWCWSKVVQGNGDLFNDLHFDGQTVWAASDGGALYKSTDGGKTWESKFKLAGARFQQIAFTDASRGWAMTTGGKLYMSVNGGEAWTLQLDRSGEPPDSAANLKLIVTDAQRVAVLGNVSKLSADGGQSWQTTDESIRTITKAGVVWGDTARSNDHGRSFKTFGAISLMAGGSLDGETLGNLRVVNDEVAVREIWRHFGISSNYRLGTAIAVTTDGGTTWIRRDIGADGPQAGLGFRWADATRIYAATAEKLWALDGVRVARSVDGGRNWSWLPKGPWPEFTAWFGDWIVKDGVPDPDDPDAFSMTVAEGLYGQGGRSVLRTTDGGLSWKRYAPDGFSPQKDVAVFRRLGPRSLVWQSGSKTLFRTDDDGAHWTLLAGTSLTQNAVGAIAFRDDKQGLAIQNNGDLLSTADGGQTWALVSPGVYQDAFPSKPAVQIFDGAVWVLRYAKEGGNTLSVSTDGGKTWKDQNAALGAAVPAAMNFFDARHGIVAMSDLRVLSTSDGGVTWTRLGALPDSTGSLSGGSMSFSGAATGMLDGVHVTRDGGATWKTGSLPAGVLPKAFRLVDALYGWGVGYRDNGYPNPNTPVLLATQDGGLTWVEKPLPAGTPLLNAVHFQTLQLGWLVGNAGTVLMTRDAGATWAKQDVGPTTRNFTAVHFNSSKTGWLGGSLGEFMATGTGGY